MSSWTNPRFDYRGAQVLVTGATSGIGAGIAAAYRDAGAADLAHLGFGQGQQFLAFQLDATAGDAPGRWQQASPNFTFVPVLSDPLPDDAWPGRTGLVHEAMLADFPDLSGHEVYVCGSVKMVEAAVPAFIAQGLSEETCFSDAFVPSAGRAVAA